MSHATLVSAERLLPSTIATAMQNQYRLAVDTVGISDVREIIAQVYARPLSDQAAFTVVIICRSIRIEAQQAFLKVLEEPPQNVQFYLVVEDHASLLPTIHSRVTARIVEDTTIDTTVTESFLRLSPADRLKAVAERVEKKDRAWMQALLAGAEELLRQRVLPATVASEVLYVTQASAAPGASLKMLFEHLALALPQLN